MIHINELWVMQQSVVRGGEQIEGMIAYVKAGGIWTLPAIKAHAETHGRRAAAIYITQFPDEERMVHDGHKRVMATFMAGRHFLLEEEYVIKPWSYESYYEIAPDRGFVTPFDPKTEVRLDDFGDYKNYVLELAKTDLNAARQYVLDNHNRYAEPRLIKTVEELANSYVSLQEAA